MIAPTSDSLALLEQLVIPATPFYAGSVRSILCSPPVVEMVRGLIEERDRYRQNDKSRMDEWQSMDNAPRDGSHILVCQGPYKSGWTFMQRPPAVVHWWSNPGEEGFYLSYGGSEDETPTVWTHWKTLGEPPANVTWLQEQLEIATREIAKWPEWKRKELEAWMRK